jgi:hypothetical protein
MSPIINLQRKLSEVGRIRLGSKSENGAPKKLDKFRLTSKSRDALEAAATIYGGKVVAWNSPDGDAFELVTTSSVLDVTIPPGNSLTQWYEMWTGAGCQRRCDGQTETINNTPCRCPADQSQRSELSSKGQACRPTTRLSVILPRVKNLGIWRLESHGYHAAVELAGIADLLQQVSASDQYLPATLRLEQRSSKKGGKTSRYAVPVLEVGATVQEAIAALSNTSTIPLLPTAPTPTPFELRNDNGAVQNNSVIAPSVYIEPELEEKEESGYYSEPVKKLSELKPVRIIEEHTSEVMTSKQPKKVETFTDVDIDNPFADESTPTLKSYIATIHIIKNELGLTDAQYRTGLKQFGVTTSKDLTIEQAKQVINKLTIAKKKKGL